MATTPLKNTELPNGWSKQEIKRKNGLNPGKIDFYIKSPRGNIFRSKKSLLDYIKQNNLPYKIEQFFHCGSETKPSPLNNMENENVTPGKFICKSNYSFELGHQDNSPRVIENGSKNLSENRNKQFTVDSDKIDKFQRMTSTKEIMTQTDVSINTTIMCDEILNKKWLSDEILQNYFEILNNAFLNSKNVIIMNPLIGQAIKICEDFEHFLEPLEIKNKQILIIPINDSENTGGEGGSHWSLLVYYRKMQEFHYFDSNNNYNLVHAEKIKTKLINYLQIKQETSITICPTPQQINNYDCGIYVIFIVESLIYKIIMNNMCNVINPVESLELTEIELISKRAFLAYIIFNRTTVNKDTVFSLMFQHCLESTDKNKNYGKEKENASKKINNKQTLPLTTSSVNSNDKNGQLLILADSQGRNLSKYTSNVWPSDNKKTISSIFKPNATLSEVVNDVGELTKFFTKKDFVVVLGGSNNEIKNKRKQLFYDVERLLKQTEHTNVLVAGLPYRHHLPVENDLINYINIDLEHNIIRKTHHATFLPINNLARHFYTKHGLHFNTRGKRKIAEMIRDLTTGLLKNGTNNKSNHTNTYKGDHLTSLLPSPEKSLRIDDTTISPLDASSPGVVSRPIEAVHENLPKPGSKVLSTDIEPMTALVKSQPTKKVKVSPGDLTYSESLKQSKSAIISEVSADSVEDSLISSIKESRVTVNYDERYCKNGTGNKNSSFSKNINKRNNQDSCKNSIGTINATNKCYNLRHKGNMQKYSPKKKNSKACLSPNSLESVFLDQI